MTNFTFAELCARHAAALKRLEEIGALLPNLPVGKLDELVGESYVQQLSALTDDEAIQYLKAVDDTKCMEAYFVLSKRLSPPVLGEICLEYLGRSALDTRLLGASEIGPVLLATQHKGACHALATIVRNANEASSVRRMAYFSLELVDKGLSEGLCYPVDMDAVRDGRLPMIDWKFVDSFISKEA